MLLPLGGIRSLNISLKQDPDGLLYDGVDTGFGIFVNLIEPDVVLAIAGVAKLRHVEDQSLGMKALMRVEG